MKFLIEYSEKNKTYAPVLVFFEKYEQEHNLDIDRLTVKELEEINHFISSEYAATTRRKYLSALNGYLNFIAEKEGIENPFKKTDITVTLNSYGYREEYEFRFLFYNELIGYLRERIENYIEDNGIHRGIEFDKLVRGYSYYLAAYTLQWCGITNNHIPKILRSDVDLKKHTVCGVKIPNSGWVYIKDVFVDDEYYVLQGKINCYPYISSKYLFRPRKGREGVITTTILRKQLNYFETNIIKSEKTILEADIISAGLFSRFIIGEKNYTSLFSTELEVELQKYSEENVIGKSLSFPNLKRRYELYRQSLFRYLIEKDSDLESLIL